jgi:hypothetical protein
MNEEAIARAFEDRFPAKAFKEKSELQVRLDGVHEHLHQSFSGDEFTLDSEEGWHGHLEDVDCLIKSLNACSPARSMWF